MLERIPDPYSVNAIADDLSEAWAKASAIAAGITGARDIPNEEVLDGLAQLTWELADAIKAMKDKVHPRNIEQEIAWIRENAERRVADLLEDQEEEPDDDKPSPKLKVVSRAQVEGEGQ